MTALTKPPSAAKPQATALVRWLMTLGAGLVLGAVLAVVWHYRAAVWQEIAAPLAGAGALAWSFAQKQWAARREWIALLTPPPAGAAPPEPSPIVAAVLGRLTRTAPALAAAEPPKPQPAATAKTPETPMTFDLKTALGPVLEGALAALPADTAGNIAAVIADGITAAQGGVDAAIEEAKNAAPPWLAPAAPVVAEFLDRQAADAAAVAKEKLATADAVKRALGLAA